MRTGKILSIRNRRLSGQYASVWIAAGLVAVVFALVWGAANGPAGEAPFIEYQLRDPGAPARPAQTAQPAKTAEARRPSSPGSADKIPAVIRANRFELVDAKGEVWADLKMEKYGSGFRPVLRMIRPDGKTFIQIRPSHMGAAIRSFSENEEVAELILCDAARGGSPVLRLRHTYHTSRGTTHASVWSSSRSRGRESPGDP